MRTIKLILILLLVLTTLVFGFTKGSRFLSGAEEGPSISCDETIPVISVDDDKSVLLVGVTAEDRQDGDLTNQVMVAGVSKLLNENTAKVTYLVFDSDDNMAQLEREFRYSDYRRPVIRVLDELRLEVADTAELLSRIHASDVIDGDLSSAVRISSLANTERSNVRLINVMVTNSMGDTAKVELPVIIEEASASRPRISLSQHLIYLDVGADFDPYSHIRRVSVNDSTINARTVEVEGLPDADVPGTYHVTYSYTDGEETGIAFLTVVIR